MTDSQFRATSPEDAGAVRAFLQRVFALDDSAPVVEPRHLHWKCWEERPDWPGSRGYVISRQGAIMAHGCVVPLSFQCGERRLKVVYLIDWAAEPGSVGSGAALLKRIGKMVDAILVVGGSDMTQKILPALGFKTRGQVTGFARPLHPLARLAGQKPTARLGAQFARSLRWTWTAPRQDLSGWEAHRVAPEDLASTAIPWPKPGSGVTIVERSPELMSYFLRCPAARMELYSVAKQASVRGYFLLAFPPAQARLVDCWIDSSDGGDWRALVQLAVRQARSNASVAEIVSVASDALIHQSLAGSGFHPRGDNPLRMLASRGAELPDTPVRFQMLDSDTAYLHTGTPEFLA